MDFSVLVLDIWLILFERSRNVYNKHCAQDVRPRVFAVILITSCGTSNLFSKKTSFYDGKTKQGMKYFNDEYKKYACEI